MRTTLILLTLLLLAESATAQRLKVLTHDSFAVPEAVVEAFTAQTGIEVEFLSGGDAGEAVNRAILTRARPLADVLFGVDNSLIARAIREGVFEPYLSPALAGVPEALRFDPSGSVTPVDVGYVNFNLDRAFFETSSLEPPTDLTDLTKPAFRGLTAVENPATSSPGLAFLLATVVRFGEGGSYDWLDFWADLRANDVHVSAGWTEAYYGAFSRYGGDRPVVLSYATSPAAEVIFSESPLNQAPTTNLFCLACAYRQIEAVGILAGTERRAEAEAFIDFMLSPTFQASIPLNMFVYPAVANIELPEAFDLFAPIPQGTEVAELPPETVEAHQQRWLEQWTKVVMQGRDPSEVR